MITARARFIALYYTPVKLMKKRHRTLSAPGIRIINIHTAWCTKYIYIYTHNIYCQALHHIKSRANFLPLNLEECVLSPFFFLSLSVFDLTWLQGARRDAWLIDRSTIQFRLTCFTFLSTSSATFRFQPDFMPLQQLVARMTREMSVNNEMNFSENIFVIFFYWFNEFCVVERRTVTTTSKNAWFLKEKKMFVSKNDLKTDETIIKQ